VASLIVLISLFLPWFEASATSSFGSQSGSESGTDAHGWLWVVFILVLVIVGFLVLKAGFSKLPFSLPVPEEAVLLAAAGIDLLLILVAFLLKPSVGPTFGISVSIGWDVGAYVGLVAAIVAVVPLARAALTLNSASRSQ
jgi:hypothetical protein